METRIRSSGKNNLKKFKSYYVVWKHNFQREIEKRWGGFKSYYVVWKLSSVSNFSATVEV